MNTHLKQLWAAMKLPKNFKKSYKFFCLGLDIRVMEVMDLIRERRSIRSYDGRVVETEQLKKVLEAGRLAPSARNMQEWKFVIVQ